MATQKKKSFVLYYDLLDQLEMLNNEQLGELTFAIFRYERYGIVPDHLSDMLKVFFSFIKATLDRDRLAYEERCQQNSQNGKRGGRPSKQSDEEPAYDPFDAQ